MMTIFACPKPFTDPHIAIIQRNAIMSWTLLRPQPEIILFGGEPYEPGVAEICQELGLRHVPEVARNRFGTPLLNDIFRKAHRLRNHDILCYINSDIILLDRIMDIVSYVKKEFDNFLIVSPAIPVDIQDSIDFTDPSWPRRLQKRANTIHFAPGSDIFIFKGNIYELMPSFAIGRPYWDVWLIGKTALSKVPTIEISNGKVVFHQNHPGSTYSRQAHASLSQMYLEEANENKKLMGKSLLSCADVPYYLAPDGQGGYRIKNRYLFPSIQIRYRLLYRNYISPIISPIWMGFLTWSYSWRHAIGLYRWWKKTHRL